VQQPVMTVLEEGKMPMKTSRLDRCRGEAEEEDGAEEEEEDEAEG
jgi:hypothetical protein